MRFHAVLSRGLDVWNGESMKSCQVERDDDVALNEMMTSRCRRCRRCRWNCQIFTSNPSQTRGFQVSYPQVLCRLSFLTSSPPGGLSFDLFCSTGFTNVYLFLSIYLSIYLFEYCFQHFQAPHCHIRPLRFGNASQSLSSADSTHGAMFFETTWSDLVVSLGEIASVHVDTKCNHLSSRHLESSRAQ